MFTRKRPFQELAHEQNSHDSTPNQVNPEIPQGEADTNLESSGDVMTDSASDLDLPIALRKGTWSCTQHPICNFMSYSKLSQRFKAGVATLDKIQIPRTVFEALEVTRMEGCVF